MTLHCVRANGLRCACGVRRGRCRDSVVVFGRTCVDPSGRSTTEPTADQIVLLVRHSAYDSTSFQVEDSVSQLKEDHIPFDLYRSFPTIDSRTYYNSTENKVQILCAEELVAHLAADIYTPVWY